MFVCVLHGRELKIIQNTVYAEQLYDGDSVHGNGYQVWSTDKWACPECGFELLVTAPHAIAQSWQEDYDRWSNRTTVTFWS